MLRHVVPAAFAAVLLILVGCARSPGTIEGEVDGAEPGLIADAVFSLFDFEDTDEKAILVVAGTADDLCTHLTEQYAFLNEMLDPNATVNDVKNAAGDFADYVNDNELVGHWTFTIDGAADRSVDFQEGNELDVDAEAGPGSDRMTFSATEQQDDPSFDENEGLDPGTASFAADEGSAAWYLDEDNTDVEVVGSVSLRDEEGDSAGDLKFEIYALPCNSLTEEFSELSDNLEANSCQYARDGECDEPEYCPAGTDTTDCG